MALCEFTHVRDLDDGRKEWHCPHCNLRPKAPGDKPPVSQCTGESPVEVIHSTTPRRATAGPCVHRGDQVGTVECASCPTSRFMLKVFACALHGQCTMGFGKPIKGKRVQCCIGCDDLTEPPINPDG